MFFTVNRSDVKRCFFIYSIIIRVKSKAIEIMDNLVLLSILINYCFYELLPLFMLHLYTYNKILT